MKIYCKKNFDGWGARYFTEGNIYEVIDESGDGLTVKSDTGTLVGAIKSSVEDGSNPYLEIYKEDANKMMKSNVVPVNETVLVVIDQLVHDDEMFTSVDVSNAVKATVDVRHSVVRDVLRKWSRDEMASEGYESTLISVNTPTGASDAYLYHPQGSDPSDYTNRSARTTPVVRTSSYSTRPVSNDHAVSISSSHPATGGFVSPTTSFIGSTYAAPPATFKPATPTTTVAKQNDRIRIPAIVAYQAGLKVGDALKVKALAGMIELEFTAKKDSGDLQVTSDGRINLTDKWLAEALLDSNNSFNIAINGGLIVVTD